MSEYKPYPYAELTADMHTAYTDLMEVTTRAYEQLEAVIVRRRELLEVRDAVLLTHKDDQKTMGTNEATRDAFLRRQTATERERLETEEAGLREAENTLKLASLTVEGARAGLRILEAFADCQSNADSSLTRAGHAVWQ